MIIRGNGISELMTDKDELGIGYGDPLLLQMMMFKRERIALAELFERQLALIGKELREAQDFVLRETDKELTGRREQFKRGAGGFTGDFDDKNFSQRGYAFKYAIYYPADDA